MRFFGINSAWWDTGLDLYIVTCWVVQICNSCKVYIPETCAQIACIYRFFPENPDVNSIYIYIYAYSHSTKFQTHPQWSCPNCLADFDRWKSCTEMPKLEDPWRCAWDYILYIIIVQLCMHFCYTLQFYPADPFNRILYIPTNIMRVCRPPTWMPKPRFLISEAEVMHQLQQDLVLQGRRTILELELCIPVVVDNLSLYISFSIMNVKPIDTPWHGMRSKWLKFLWLFTYTFVPGKVHVSEFALIFETFIRIWHCQWKKLYTDRDFARSTNRSTTFFLITPWVEHLGIFVLLPVYTYAE